MKIGGRAYKNGVRLHGTNYSVKAYYKDKELKYKVIKNRSYNNKFISYFKKIPIIRGVISFIMAIYYFLKEATAKPKRYWPILLLLVLNIAFEVYINLSPPSRDLYLIELFIEYLYFNPIIYYLLLIIILFILRQTVLKETFKFHGAEHKAVNYYESDFKGNITSHSRLASRCGTNLVVFYIIITYFLEYLGIIFNVYLESLLIIGLAYEILLIAPGWVLSIANLFQKFTTIEPDDRHLNASKKALDLLLTMENSK